MKDVMDIQVLVAYATKYGAPKGDFRDWEAIISWATSTGDALKKSPS